MFGVSLRVASPVRSGRPASGGVQQQQTGSAPATPSKCSTTSDYGALAAAVAGVAAAGGFSHQEQPMMMTMASTLTSTATATAALPPSSSSLPLVTPLPRPGLLAAPAPPRKSALFETTRTDLGEAMATAATTNGGALAPTTTATATATTTATSSSSSSSTLVSANEVSARLTSLPPTLPPFPGQQRPHPASAPERRGRPPRPPASSRSFARVRVRRTLDMRGGGGSGGGSGIGIGRAGSGSLSSSSASLRRDPLAPLPSAATKVRFSAGNGSSRRASLPPAPLPSCGFKNGGRRRADTPGCCGGRLAGRRPLGALSEDGGKGGDENEIEVETAANATAAAAASDAAAGLVAKLSLDAVFG